MTQKQTNQFTKAKFNTTNRKYVDMIQRGGSAMAENIPARMALEENNQEKYYYMAV